MLDNVIGFVAPHHCCGCDQIGSLLCEYCKYNITSELNMVCIVCGRPSSLTHLCKDCKVLYQKAWFVGERKDTLQRLIGLYKFERTKSAYKLLGDLLLEILPVLPSDTVIVPVPTVPSHIRERGYDHTLLVARYIARRRDLKLKRLIIRKTGTKQRQASSSDREKQAKEAFTVEKVLDPNMPYLIIDDVFTTGATVKYCAKALKEAGAKIIWITVIARQTLD